VLPPPGQMVTPADKTRGVFSFYNEITRTSERT
jgi:hypothetical protein